MSERRSCVALGDLISLDAIRPGATSPAYPRLAEKGVRYGCFRIYIRLRREGSRVYHKCVRRLYREYGLSLRLKRPRWHVTAAARDCQPAAAAPNELCSIDDCQGGRRAVSRHTMRFVEIRSPEQVNLQPSNRVGNRLVAQRTRVICQMRAFCLGA